MKAVVETADELRRGREAYTNRAWLDAYTALSSADRAAPLQAEDLELLATSASMVGRMDDYLAVLERAHLAHLDAGESARCGSVRVLARDERSRSGVRSARRAAGSPAASDWSSGRGGTASSSG